MATRIEGVLSPIAENLREMGLSYSEIGRFFTFLGHELSERASHEEEPHGRSNHLGPARARAGDAEDLSSMPDGRLETAELRVQR